VNDDPRILRILEKLARVRREKPSYFGSDAHRLELRATLREEDVAAFEANHGVRLPASYRSFLLRAGDGGAGPFCGIDPLGKWDAFASWIADDVPADWLVRPCPLAPTLPGDPAWGYVEVRGGWLAALGKTDETARDAYAGTMALGSQGCSYVTLLVTSGPYAGRVVYADADHVRPPYFVHNADFLDWYERWLDELLAGTLGVWFGFGMSGSEPTLVRTLFDASVAAGVRVEAGTSLLKLPTLAPESAAAFLRGLGDPLAWVRTSAVSAVVKHRLHDGIARLFEMLHDDDAEVRRSVARGLAELGCSGWGDAVRPLLHDPAPAVVSTVLLALHKADLIDRGDVMPLLRAESADTRRLALWAGPWTAADEPCLVPLLDDSSKYVRDGAVLALRRGGARGAASRLAEKLRVEVDVESLETLTHALGDLGDAATALEPIATLLRHPDDFVRLAAIEALGNLADPRAAPLLAPFLADRTTPSRRGPRSGRGHTKTFAELTAPAYERCRPKPLR
jgi:HEAT repeat protein